jgi:hypothetical protein
VEIPSLRGFPFQSTKILDLDHIEQTSECPFCSFLRSIGKQVTEQVDKGEGHDHLKYYLKFNQSTGSPVRPSPTLRLQLHAFRASQVLTTTDGGESSRLFAVVSAGDRLSKDWYEDNAHRCFTSVNSDWTTHGGIISSENMNYGLVKAWFLEADRSDHLVNGSPRVSLGVANMLFIDCRSRSVVRTITPPESYVTLSYVWGVGAASNEVVLGRLRDDLPLVVEDAIKVTRALEHQYLWVDRYCIPDDKEVKQAMIKAMGDIYTSSAFTIIAAAGEDPDHGLPRVSSRKGTFYQSRFRHQQFEFVSLPPHVRQEVGQSMWATRGWTYQEGALSPRRLIFTPSQIYLQCGSWAGGGSLGFSECLTGAIGAQVLGPDTSNEYDHPDSLQRLLYSIHEYNRRDMKFDSDVLDGFQGVLQHSSNSNFFGLPIVNLRRSDLTYAMSWNISGQCRQRDSWPTWTWLGWKGGNFTNKFRLGRQSFSFDNEERENDLDEGSSWFMRFLLDISVQFKDDHDNLSEINEATTLSRIQDKEHIHFLHLNGFILPLKFGKDTEAETWRAESPFSHWLFEFESEDTENITQRILEQTLASTLRVSLIALFTVLLRDDLGHCLEFLVLRKAQAMDCYERLPNGHFQLHCYDNDDYVLSGSDTDDDVMDNDDEAIEDDDKKLEFHGGLEFFRSDDDDLDEDNEEYDETHTEIRNDETRFQERKTQRELENIRRENGKIERERDTIRIQNEELNRRNESIEQGKSSTRSDHDHIDDYTDPKRAQSDFDGVRPWKLIDGKLIIDDMVAEKMTLKVG